jgi:sirohydrochlorin ferrochelatase
VATSEARESETAPSERTAVLLIAHGSRREEANRDLAEIARQLRDLRRFHCVEVSYLELAKPTIPEGCRTCVQSGAERVLMLPYFLSAGKHVRDDLQQYRAEQAALYPQVEFQLCPPLGLHPLMLQIVLDRLTEKDEASLNRATPQNLTA